MATEYAHSSDGYVVRYNQASWADARNGADGTGADSTTTGQAYAAAGYRASARGGGYVFNVYRSFMRFDTSGISTNVDSATLKIYGFSQAGGDLIVVKATSDISSLGTADFDSIVGWNNSSADGSGAGDMESAVTKYSAEITSWSTSGYNDITLNAQALADMRDDSVLYICFLNFDYDLKDIAPTGYSSHRNGMYYEGYTGTSRDPYIDYTLAVAAADNAIFFGTNF